MGEQSSKPIISNPSHAITQYYSPFIQDHRLPGRPQLLKLNNALISKQNPISHQQIDPIIQCYRFQLALSQQEALRWQRTYAERKHSLPWHVKVLSYELIKDQCHCANSKYKAIVYTEHLETRLCNFQVQRKEKRGSYNQMEILDSFDLSQGIYVLINLLHGYQLLLEQFRVNYPTPYSIGINRKGQVKVWLCDNLAHNRQNHRTIPDHLLIQELISLVDERTVGSVASVLKNDVNYMNWSFQKLQEALSEHTIHFNLGRKTLMKRINKGVGGLKNKEKVNKKYPLSSSKKDKNIEFYLPLEQQYRTSTTTQRGYHQLPTTQRRTKSSEPNPDSRNQIIFVHPSERKSIEIPRTPAYQSPSKAIKFVYEQNRAQSNQASPKLTSSTYDPSYLPSPVRTPTFQQSSLLQPKMGSFPIFSKQSSKKSLYRSHKSSQNAIAQSVILNKINSQFRTNQFQRSKPVNTNLGIEAFVIHNVQRVESAKTIEKTPPTSQGKLGFLQPQVVSKIVISDASSEKESLTDLTKEFKNLLKSQKKISNSQAHFDPALTSYQLVNLTLDHSSQGQANPSQKLILNQNSEDLLPSYMEIHFQSIKEVDEQRSYSVDEYM